MTEPFDREGDENPGVDDPASDYREETWEFDAGFEVPEVPGSESDPGVDYEDVDPELHKQFWKVVLAIKFTLLAVTVGSLLVVFGENAGLGRRILLFGAALAVYTAYQYRKTKARIDAGAFEESGEESEADDRTDGEER